MADQSAGRVSLHPCFHFGLSTASTEITGEGGTPALFCHRRTKVVARSGGRDLHDEIFSEMWHKYFVGNVIEYGGEGGR